MVKVQLAYPKIPDSKNCPWERCIAFEKYDGTNLHWVWDCELGWYAFGTRRDRFDLDDMGIAQFNQAHPGLETATEIFQKDFAIPLETVSTSHEELLIPLNPEVEANIIGGVKLTSTNEGGRNSTNISIEENNAKIRVELGKVTPNQTFSNKFGNCTSYFNKFTGQLSFSCTLKDTYPI
ncbi:hypothetical protein [Nostoc sp. CMAA1605]|uniref:hypothetical protein n=1 Tax=Nostoc sp. CMAA1605 TaxID=2055159 RepID=UPI001F15E5D9|nr:hypothetical protein [Nostoc sp. CMAA1605]